MADLTVYEKLTCTTCRRVQQLSHEPGIDSKRFECHVTGFSKDGLDGLHTRACTPTREAPWTTRLAADLGLNDPGVGKNALIAAMAERPVFLQRPNVLWRDRAALSRSVECVLELG